MSYDDIQDGCTSRWLNATDFGGNCAIHSGGTVDAIMPLFWGRTAPCMMREVS